MIKVIMIILAISCLSMDYYVDPVNGNDSWAGTQTYPWKTLDKVYTYSSYNAGDSVLLKSDTIFRETLKIPASGNTTSDFVIGIYGGSTMPIITGADLVTSFYQGSASTNLILNSSFESGLSNWTTSGTVDTITDPRYGQKAARLCTLEDDPAMEQDVSLSASTDYLLSLHHHEEECAGHYDAEIVVFLYDGNAYWDGEYWVLTKTPALVSHAPEWSVETIPFTSGNSGTYTIEITVDDSEQYENHYVDGVFLTEVPTVYEATLTEEPEMVYITTSRDEIKQLYRDEGGSYFTWDYDQGVLQIHSDDLSQYTVEVSIRENNIDFNGQSYVTVQDIHSTMAYGTGVDLTHGTATTRNTGLSVESCRVSYSGKCGILVGHISDDDVLTPSYIVIDDCEIFAYARDGIIREAGTPWYQQSPVLSAGIVVTRGDPDDDGANVGSVYISNNEIDGNLALINYSTGRNGISIKMGDDVYIDGNTITQTDHAITVTGWYNTFEAGDVQSFEIFDNICHHNGDDGIYIHGMITADNTIHDNEIYQVLDNGIDLSSSSNYIEIYDNSIRNCVNESIIIWGSTIAGADIHNNTFVRWGPIWRSGNPGKRRGCAIGIGTGVDTQYSIIDYNAYSQDYDAGTALYPFHIDEEQYELSDWRQEEGFDVNSTLTYIY